MSFELFKDTRARTKEYISITENFTFGLPRTFINKQHIKPNQKAVIFFDPNELKVALHFTEKETKYGLAVRIPNPTQGGMVVAKSFFEVKGIDPKKYSGRYSDFKIIPLTELGFNTEGEAYVFKLVESSEKKQPAGHSDISTTADQDHDPINLDDIPW